MDFINKYNNIHSIIKKIPKNNEVLLLGESTHGTEEFYQLRSDLTKYLIENENYNIVLFETDWFNLPCNSFNNVNSSSVILFLSAEFSDLLFFNH